MRNCITQRYLLKFHYPNIQAVLRYFAFKSLTNMQNTEKSKSDTDRNINNTSPKMQEGKEKGLDVVTKNEMKDDEISGKNELVIPENFSEMERQIFIAHKDAVEVSTCI